MKNIDSKRLTNLLNWDIKTYKKEYTNMLLATFGTLTMAALVVSGYLTSFSGDFHVNHILATEITPFAIIFVMFAMLGVAGQAFQHIMTNQERIAYMMLPASNIEKFIVRVVLRTLIMFGLIIAAVVAADCFFGFLVWIRTGEFVSIIAMSQFFSYTLGVNNFGGVDWLTNVMGVMLIWSFFVLGSAFFRRRAVLKTFLCLFAFVLVFSSLIGIGVGYFLEWSRNLSQDISIEFLIEPSLLFEIIGNIVCVLWLSFNIWYSYRLFSRMQVINNRWNNK